MLIQSVQNPRIKNLIKLREKKHARLEQSAFVVEGLREILRAVSRGFVLKELYTTSGSRVVPAELLTAVTKDQVYEITQPVFEKIAVREDVDGVYAVFEMKSCDKNAFMRSSKVPSYLVFEDIEKPGNLGAILRTADGAGVDAVIVVGQSVDVFNPNVIRASIGSVFAVPVFVMTVDETMSWLRAQSVKIYAARPDAKSCYFEHDLKGPCAFVFGNEARGLSQNWNLADVISVSIPMKGLGDSLNVSVAAAVMAFEMQKQRLGDYMLQL